MKNKLVFFLLLLLVACSACLIWSLADGQKIPQDKGQKVFVAKKYGNVKKVTEISLNDKKAIKIVSSEIAKPDFLNSIKGEAGDSEEEQLTEIQKTVLRELQSALDENDVKGVRKALSKFSQCISKADSGKNNGCGRFAGLPKSMREAAVSALGWFGSETATDMIDFMMDPDEDICNDAWNQFELALADFEMGDVERATILMTMAKSITDSDRLDSIFMEFNNMRPSVKADTLISVLENGTPQAKAVLQESIEIYTESDVKTVDDVKRWKAANPDDSGDEEFYGGKKDK